MTAEKIHRAEGMYAGVFYDRYIQGQWVVAEGTVYTMFDRQRHIVPDTVKLLRTGITLSPATTAR